MLATYCPKSSRVNRNHTYMLQIWENSLKTNPKDCFQKFKSNREKKLRLLIRIRSVNRTKGVKLRFEYDHIAPSGFGVAPIKRVPTAMFSLVRIRPMFEQEAPKWPWELFNDADSNTIHVGSQRGLSYDANMIKENSPMSSALCQSNGYRQLLFSLVRIRPMFEQEAPKWPYRLRLDSNTIISRIHLQVTMWCCNGNNTFTFGGEKDRGPALLFIIIYTWL